MWGQGDGILVETPDNHHFLIDGGSGCQSDLGRYCLLPALKSQGFLIWTGFLFPIQTRIISAGRRNFWNIWEMASRPSGQDIWCFLHGRRKPEAWEELSDAAKKSRNKGCDRKKKG